MRWWFENQAGRTTWDGVGFGEGEEVRFYHLWHHRDHGEIVPGGWTDEKGEGEGKSFMVGKPTRLREQFGDYKEVIDVTAVTERLDDGAFDFSVSRYGLLTACRVVHRWEPEANGRDLAFYAETIVGVQVPVVGFLVDPLINWLIVPWIYSWSTGENWIRHNIEEVGRTEDILPALYEHHGPSASLEEKF